MSVGGLFQGKTGTDADPECSVRGQTEHFLRAPTPLLGVEQEVVDFRAGNGQGTVGIELLKVEGRHLPGSSAEKHERAAHAEGIQRAFKSVFADAVIDDVDGSALSASSTMYSA